jgi:hypothetical protein
MHIIRRIYVEGDRLPASRVMQMVLPMAKTMGKQLLCATNVRGASGHAMGFRWKRLNIKEGRGPI